jgi:hypothetical protein
MPEELPEKELGKGSFPWTLIIKSDAFLLPPPSLTTLFITISFPCD